MKTARTAFDYSRRTARQLDRAYRIVTSNHRLSPDFIIIGAMKSGTSSLFHYLRQHPGLTPSHVKEVHYFDNNFDKGPRWYASHFPLRRLNRGAMTYEASPSYIFNPLVARRIYDHNPETKIIAVLRNPTQRAISHYFHERRMGREQLGIQEALQKEEERLEDALANRAYTSLEYLHYSYKARGIYHTQIKRFIDVFPDDGVFVCGSESLYRDTHEVVRRVLDFIGLNKASMDFDFAPRNVGANRKPVSARLHAYLDDYFRPHNKKLYTLLGRSLNW